MIIIPQSIVIAIGVSLMTYFAITYPEPCPKKYSSGLIALSNGSGFTPYSR